MSTDPLSAPPAGASGPGGMMRLAREAKGMHITMLATTLRVPPDRLKALESEKWADLPDLVFARALAMSVCRQLKIDPAPVLAAMPDPDPHRSVRLTAAISTPLGGMASPSDGRQRVWQVAGLVVVALVIWMGWVMLLDQDSRPSTSVEVPEMPPVTENPAPGGPAPSEAAPSEASATTPVVTPTSPAASSGALPASTPTPSPAPTAATPAQAGTLVTPPASAPVTAPATATKP